MNISTECNYVAMCGFKEKEVQKLVEDVGFDIKFCVPNYVSEVLYARVCRYFSRKITN